MNQFDFLFFARYSSLLLRIIMDALITRATQSINKILESLSSGLDSYYRSVLIDARDLLPRLLEVNILEND